MTFKKMILPTLGLGALILTGTLGVNSVRADETNSNPPIIQTLINKFGLNQEEVVEVFQQERQQHFQNRGENRRAGLDQALEDGVITAEQRQLMLDHQAEMEQERETRRQDHQAWAEQNGIDTEALHSYRMNEGQGFRGGFK